MLYVGFFKKNPNLTALCLETFRVLISEVRVTGAPMYRYSGICYQVIVSICIPLSRILDTNVLVQN